ncbi:MAG: DNA polymerase III subunit beta [Steroidobacteraceae bacterium]
MKITATRDQFLKPLQSVIGVVERRQTMPILSNILLSARNDSVTMTGTDLEVELVARSPARVSQPGDITVPGRKFLDICRALPETAEITLSADGEKIQMRAGRSRFTLAGLPAADFPVIEDIKSRETLTLPQAAFKHLIDKTHFSMAQQDVRYYLNGLLLETEGKTLRTVATDGHRLALAETALNEKASHALQVIVPRKGVLELQRILAGEDNLELAIGSNHIRAQIGDIRFTSKLIDGKFPEYGRVIPATPPHTVKADRDVMRQALQRTAILSNEKYRGVRLTLGPNSLSTQAHNPEQEEAEDQIEVEYSGDAIEIGFNVTYLLEALAAVDQSTVEIGLTDANSSCLISGSGEKGSRYVIMPMRL